MYIVGKENKDTETKVENNIEQLITLLKEKIIPAGLLELLEIRPGEVFSGDSGKNEIEDVYIHSKVLGSRDVSVSSVMTALAKATDIKPAYSVGSVEIDLKQANLLFQKLNNKTPAELDNLKAEITDNFISNQKANVALLLKQDESTKAHRTTEFEAFLRTNPSPKQLADYAQKVEQTNQLLTTPARAMAQRNWGAGNRPATASHNTPQAANPPGKATSSVKSPEHRY